MFLNDNLHVVTTARSLSACRHLSELQRKVKSMATCNDLSAKANKDLDKGGQRKSRKSKTKKLAQEAGNQGAKSTRVVDW